MLSDPPAWTADACALVRQAIDCQTPLLGVCFGHQLLAYAVGGRVGRNPRGWAVGCSACEVHAGDDPLLSILPRRFTTLLSHREVVLTASEHIEVLGSAIHDPHHVIRVGDWAWGVQFHPEFTTTIITAILRERAQILDEVMGLGYAKHQERNLQPARPATLLLNQFVQLCRQKTTTV